MDKNRRIVEGARARSTRDVRHRAVGCPPHLLAAARAHLVTSVPAEAVIRLGFADVRRPPAPFCGCVISVEPRVIILDAGVLTVDPRGSWG